jgi:hypothetical protein
MNALDVVADGVYRRGLTRTARAMNVSAGNLSCALRRRTDPRRIFGVDDLERYIEVTGDYAPIYYLVKRFLADQASARDAALSQVSEQLQSVLSMMAAAGLSTNTSSKGRR